MTLTMMFSATATHLINISGKFHGNLVTKYGDIASCKIGVNRRTTDGGMDKWTAVQKTAKHNAFKCCVWLVEA